MKGVLFAPLVRRVPSAALPNLAKKNWAAFAFSFIKYTCCLWGQQQGKGLAGQLTGHWNSPRIENLPWQRSDPLVWLVKYDFFLLDSSVRYVGFGSISAQLVELFPSSLPAQLLLFRDFWDIIGNRYLPSLALLANPLQLGNPARP